MRASPPFLYPSLQSPFVAALSVVSIVTGASICVSELRGENMAYSKFAHVVAATSGREKQWRAGALLPSRVGMLVAYAPALLAVLASFPVLGAAVGLRGRLLSATLAVHFLKRVLEVLFVHRYSGSMPLASAVTVSTGYLLNSVMMIYAQHLTHGLPDPAVNLLYPGVLVFVIGAAGNFYHHLLLSRLRARTGDSGGKGYKIPRGGLFDLVACPHYLFEIVVFLGFAMIAQTVFALAVAISTTVYLAGRSCATRRWYTSKFEEFPTGIRALVPYVL
ncbi:hypothetical protein PR202_ga28284 [Eleusine coracana subsp. coracana]|uniref:3-oxo-5-alpha-steroid 4-dehydrogenase C-terminal domain-containing protein n=1 Tax=Eleusine coracana subsp. coracana TaxID=191504 RepID=A0AAV5DIS8_ELECO|nr:hypothetical protein QOZ80_7AG0556520 [Eleusine coracana subsp. coracana]GJN10207.1 hypothetical protein PR202_ga28284 [Eleusine coracana subsp. coracana]